MAASHTSAQTAASSRLSRSGADVYRSACAACHGADGKGTPVSQIGFTDVEVPDFTDCSFSTVEPGADWQAVVHDGGPARGFSRKMPAFTDALSREEIASVVDHLRGFCRNRAWPLGDLNLPRPLVTEKAFPENETVVTTTISRTGATSVENEFVYEHRIGARSQYEVVVPFTVQRESDTTWGRGLGDIAVALKHALFHRAAAGTIASVGAEAILPTGHEVAGFGGGVTIIEPFAVVSQTLPRDGFIHLHAGGEIPVKSDKSNEVFWRVAAGKTFSQARWGRAWSPMLELLGAKDLGGDEDPQWDAVPQMQVSLNTRQHILVSAGLRIPITERSTRRTSVMMYFLWDWFDGGLFSGW